MSALPWVSSWWSWESTTKSACSNSIWTDQRRTSFVFRYFSILLSLSLLRTAKATREDGWILDRWRKSNHCSAFHCPRATGRIQRSVQWWVNTRFSRECLMIVFSPRRTNTTEWRCVGSTIGFEVRRTVRVLEGFLHRLSVGLLLNITAINTFPRRFKARTTNA